MRIAIVDDLADERAWLKERLARQLALRGAAAELLALPTSFVLLPPDGAYSPSAYVSPGCGSFWWIVTLLMWLSDSATE